MLKPTLILLLLSGAVHVARADDAALRRCRALEDPAVRLACYDALPLARPANENPAPPGRTAAAGLAAATPPALPALAARSAQSASAAAASAFGLHQPDKTMQAVTSHIAGVFEGWEAGSRIRLANGQLWQVIDDSRGVYYLRDPKVAVRRAAMGTFVLDIEGARRQPRVRRLE